VAYLAEGEVGLVDSIKADYARYRFAFQDFEKSRLRATFNVLSLPMFHAVVLFRLARAAQRVGLSPVARILMYVNEVLFLTELSPQAIIGPGLFIPHPGCGCSAGTRIGKNCAMVGMVHLGIGGYTDKTKDGSPTVGDDVNLLAHASVWGPVTIGSRSVIGIGVRLLKSVPEDSAVFAPQRLMITKRPGAGDTASDEATAESTIPEVG